MKYARAKSHSTPLVQEILQVKSLQPLKALLNKSGSQGLQKTFEDDTSS